MKTVGTHEFQGSVSSRSSKRPDQGPPGEAEIQRLNPQREKLLCGSTGWTRLEPGSLNVEADEEALQTILDTRASDIFEPAESICYPPKYTHIPKLRQGYRYFHCKVVRDAVECTALVRRAKNPLKRRVELFANLNLRDLLGVNDGDKLTIRLAEVTK